jgi:hypothetical protein
MTTAQTAWRDLGDIEFQGATTKVDSNHSI